MKINYNLKYGVLVLEFAEGESDKVNVDVWDKWGNEYDVGIHARQKRRRSSRGFNKRNHYRRQSCKHAPPYNCNA